MKAFFAKYQRETVNAIVAMAVGLLGGIVGYGVHDRFNPRPTIDVTAPEVQNVIIKCAKGKGSFVINVSDGWVKNNSCPIDDAAKGFWQTINSMAGKTCLPPN
jgi:hypothetical protein